MPVLIPAIVSASGAAIAAGAITVGVVADFFVTLALTGLYFTDEDGTEWELDR